MSRSPWLWATAACAVLAAGIGLVFVFGSKSSPAPGPADVEDKSGFYRDATAESGVAMTYRNGEEALRFAILESLGGGVAVIDYDRDGLPDLFFPGGGTFDGADKQTIRGVAPKLYRNLGNFKFEDVSSTLKLADGAEWFYSHGVAVADYDRDGFPDLVMTGYGRIALFHNEPGPNGTRVFRDATKAAGLLGDHFWSSSAAFGDLDGDGYPDLYLAQYVNWSNENDPPCNGYFQGIPRDVCPPKKFGSVPHALWRNNGNGTFTNVSAAAGIRVKHPKNDYGKGLGVLFIDVNLDGKPDIYVANDTTEKFLYLNESTPGKLSFADRGYELGVALDGGGGTNGSMGIDASDYDGSGRPSIWVTNYENELHALYRNLLIKDPKTQQDRMMFSYYTSPAGLSVIGPRFVGFGTLFLDMDRDGWEDIVVNNGHVMQFHKNDFVRQPPIAFFNTDRNGQRFFIENSRPCGTYFRDAHRGRGLAVADLDNDGRPDLIFCNVNNPVAILRHEGFPDAHWLGLTLTGRDNADVTAARVVVEAGGRKITRFVARGRSYLSHSDDRLLIATGKDVPGIVTVYWPHGTPRVERFDLATDKYHVVEQGKGK